MGKDKIFIWGTGRRKTSVARVRIKPGTGTFVVNDKEMSSYFTRLDHQRECVVALEDAGAMGKLDIFATVDGGGVTGQAGAVRMGLARALLASDESLRGAIRSGGHNSRDGRMKERKKYGQRGARRRFQFSKR